MSATNKAGSAIKKLAHLSAQAQLLLSEPLPTRIRAVLKSPVVLHGRLLSLLNEVEWMMAQAGAVRTRGLLVRSPPGNGKTSFGAVLLQRYPLVPPPLNGSRPSTNNGCAVQINLAGARTSKTFFVRLLASLQCAPIRGTSTELEMRSKDILRRAACRLVIIDEMQDLLNAPHREQLGVVEAIKNLMTELRIPILTLGTVSAAENYRTGAHMMARFRTLDLPAWEQGPELAAMMHGIESTLPLANPSYLKRPEVTKELLRSTGGVLDDMLDMIRVAAVHAITSGEERISLEMLRGRLRLPDFATTMGGQHDST